MDTGPSVLRAVDIDPSVVSQISLQTFASFAELTTHESVVADSIASDERTRQSVVSFLTGVTNRDILRDFTFYARQL